MFEYSLWSSAQIRTPLPATTTAVAETITPVATRTEGRFAQNTREFPFEESCA
jgi:hypothetical protein